MNKHDNALFLDSFYTLLETADDLSIPLEGSYITFDPGFDCEANKTTILYHGLVPVIKPNIRGTKDTEKIQQRYDDFNEKIYKERYKVERCFAWHETYRKLVVRYEKLQCTHLGFRHLAYALINFRSIFNHYW